MADTDDDDSIVAIEINAIAGPSWTPATNINDGGQEIVEDSACLKYIETYNEEVYPTVSPVIGFALLINVIRFDRPEHPRRHGAERDTLRLRKYLEAVGFQVYCIEDPQTSNDVEAEIVKFKRLFETVQVNSCIVAVMSHGVGEDYIVTASGQLVSIWTGIVEKFNNEHCRQLRGIPKIFLLQHCRGDVTDPGTPTGIQIDCCKTSDKPEFTVASWTDILVCYSTVQGYYSYRNPENGTWFIQTLCQVFEKHGRRFDLLKMLNIVSGAMMRREGTNGQKQICNYHIIGFHKEFYFVPSHREARNVPALDQPDSPAAPTSGLDQYTKIVEDSAIAYGQGIRDTKFVTVDHGTRLFLPADKLKETMTKDGAKGWKDCEGKLWATFHQLSNTHANDFQKRTEELNAVIWKDHGQMKADIEKNTKDAIVVCSLSFQQKLDQKVETPPLCFDLNRLEVARQKMLDETLVLFGQRCQIEINPQMNRENLTTELDTIYHNRITQLIEQLTMICTQTGQPFLDEYEKWCKVDLVKNPFYSDQEAERILVNKLETKVTEFKTEINRYFVDDGVSWVQDVMKKFKNSLTKSNQQLVAWAQKSREKATASVESAVHFCMTKFSALLKNDPNFSVNHPNQEIPSAQILDLFTAVRQEVIGLFRNLWKFPHCPQEDLIMVRLGRLMKDEFDVQVEILKYVARRGQTAIHNYSETMKIELQDKILSKDAIQVIHLRVQEAKIQQSENKFSQPFVANVCLEMKKILDRLQAQNQAKQIEFKRNVNKVLEIQSRSYIKEIKLFLRQCPNFDEAQEKIPEYKSQFRSGLQTSFRELLHQHHVDINDKDHVNSLWSECGSCMAQLFEEMDVLVALKSWDEVCAIRTSADGMDETNLRKMDQMPVTPPERSPELQFDTKMAEESPVTTSNALERPQTLAIASTHGLKCVPASKNVQKSLASSSNNGHKGERLGIETDHQIDVKAPTVPSSRRMEHEEASTAPSDEATSKQNLGKGKSYLSPAPPEASQCLSTTPLPNPVAPVPSGLCTETLALYLSFDEIQAGFMNDDCEFKFLGASENVLYVDLVGTVMVEKVTMDPFPNLTTTKVRLTKDFKVLPICPVDLVSDDEDYAMATLAPVLNVEEFLALRFESFKRMAELKFCKNFQNCIIAVAQSLTPDQRQVVRVAAEMALFHKIDLINDTHALALDFYIFSSQKIRDNVATFVYKSGYISAASFEIDEGLIQLKSVAKEMSYNESYFGALKSALVGSSKSSRSNFSMVYNQLSLPMTLVAACSRAQFGTIKDSRCHRGEFHLSENRSVLRGASLLPHIEAAKPGKTVRFHCFPCVLAQRLKDEHRFLENMEAEKESSAVCRGTTKEPKQFRQPPNFITKGRVLHDVKMQFFSYYQHLQKEMNLRMGESKCVLWAFQLEYYFLKIGDCELLDARKALDFAKSLFIRFE